LTIGVLVKVRAQAATKSSGFTSPASRVIKAPKLQDAPFWARSLSTTPTSVMKNSRERSTRIAWSGSANPDLHWEAVDVANPIESLNLDLSQWPVSILAKCPKTVGIEPRWLGPTRP
jgi:hypothetical protein